MKMFDNMNNLAAVVWQPEKSRCTDSLQNLSLRLKLTRMENVTNFKRERPNRRHSGRKPEPKLHQQKQLSVPVGLLLWAALAGRDHSSNQLSLQ